MKTVTAVFNKLSCLTGNVSGIKFARWQHPAVAVAGTTVLQVILLQKLRKTFYS